MDILLIMAMSLFLIIVLLPFWLNASKVSKDKRFLQDVLPPGSRRYTLMKPVTIPPGEKLPLVIALHFGGHGFPYYGELFLTDLIEPSLRGLGALMVAPDCPGKDWTQPASEQFILDLLDHIQDQYSTDPERVLITGFSMGGIGVWHLLSRFPDRFTAALIMAANPPEGAGEIEWDGPLYILHGNKDERFPIVNTTRVVIQLEERGFDLLYRVLESAAHYDTHKFKAPLEAAVPWILDRWGRES